MPVPLRTTAEIQAELAEIENNLAGAEGEGDGDEGSEQLSGDLADDPAVVEASAKGWVPKDKYKGDPAKWVDAATFNERGNRYAKNLQRDLDAVKQELAAFKGTAKAFEKFANETIERKNQELDDAIKALRIQRSQAVRDGDDEEAINIEDRIDLLKDQKAAAKAAVIEQKAEFDPEQALKDPILQEWVEDGNEWFRDDERLMKYAVQIGENLIKNGETLKGRKFLDKVAGLIKEEFPRSFAKATGNKAALSGDRSSESNGSGGRVAGGKTERDLPPEDLKLMKDFIAAGYTTKEKFLKNYFENAEHAGRRRHAS